MGPLPYRMGPLHDMTGPLPPAPSRKGRGRSSSLSDLSFRRNYQIKPGPRLDYYYNTTRRNEAKCQNFPIFP